MKNYEPLVMTLITFTQDVVTLSNSDNVKGEPDGWEE